MSFVTKSLKKRISHKRCSGCAKWTNDFIECDKCHRIFCPKCEDLIIPIIDAPDDRVCLCRFCMDAKL